MLSLSDPTEIPPLSRKCTFGVSTFRGSVGGLGDCKSSTLGEELILMEEPQAFHDDG